MLNIHFVPGTVESVLHFDQNALLVEATEHLITLRGTEVCPNDSESVCKVRFQVEISIFLFSARFRIIINK